MMYKFFYPESNVIQYKVLIPHESWEKAKEEGSSAIKKLGNGKEWFTDKSPLYEAISTGILRCNGEHKCIITKT